jgi:hypothetical protein
MALLFNIYWSFFPGVTIDDDKIDDVTSPYIHAPLFLNTEYFYRVANYDTDTLLESELSNELSGIPFGFARSSGEIIW